MSVRACSCRGALLIRERYFPASRLRLRRVICKALSTLSTAVTTALCVAAIEASRFTTTGLVALDVRSRRFLSICISLYFAMTPTRLASSIPISDGITSFLLSGLPTYSLKKLTKRICDSFSARNLSYCDVSCSAICASVLRSVKPALCL